MHASAENEGITSGEDRLSDFTTDSRVLTLSAMALAIGVISCAVAWVLVQLIALITNVAFFQRLSNAASSPASAHLGIWIIFIPPLGGLIIGLMARYGSEKIRGHGIPEALEAILVGQSRMKPKVAVLKPISSAISIGTGGPFGAEGPIIMTGGAFGSLFAQLFHLSPAERKTLLVAGAAGGMSAIFGTPVAAVLLAVELLLFEWKPRSFIPVAVASIVAGVLRVRWLGPEPIFPVIPHTPLHAEELFFAFLVGTLAGCGSGLLTALVYGFEDLFQRLPLHWMWWPVIGGLGIGIGGWIEPRVLGVGYDLIHHMLTGEMVGVTLLGLLIGKALVWSFALGSGTSGGVLAPLLIIGGALGAIVAGWIPVGDAGLWAAVSMAAMMGGTMRSPFTAAIFLLELTHDLNILPALLAGCVASMTVTVLFLRRSILTEKVARRGHHVVREYGVDPFHLLRVKDVMDTQVPTVSQNMTVQELANRIAVRDSALARRHAVFIVDDQGRLVGIVTRGDLIRAMEEETELQKTVLQAGSHKLILASADESLHDAAARMLRHNIGRLPVIGADDPRRPVGYLGRADLLQTRWKVLHEEEGREPGWLGLRKKQKPGENGPALDS